MQDKRINHFSQLQQQQIQYILKIKDFIMNLLKIMEQLELKRTFKVSSLILNSKKLLQSSHIVQLH